MCASELCCSDKSHLDTFLFSRISSKKACNWVTKNAELFELKWLPYTATQGRVVECSILSTFPLNGNSDLQEIKLIILYLQSSLESSYDIYRAVEYQCFFGSAFWCTENLFVSVNIKMPRIMIKSEVYDPCYFSTTMLWWIKDAFLNYLHLIISRLNSG